MKLCTSTTIRTSCERLWPLLTSSQMTASDFFCLGLPRPVACELPDQAGGVGCERRCISDRGTITQVLTEWKPPQRLAFRMVATDHTWGRHVASIEETFVLTAVRAGTRITRITRLTARGPWSWLKELLFCVGVKRVHLYVFKNWRLQTEVAKV